LTGKKKRGSKRGKKKNKKKGVNLYLKGRCPGQDGKKMVRKVDRLRGMRVIKRRRVAKKKEGDDIGQKKKTLREKKKQRIGVVFNRRPSWKR